MSAHYSGSWWLNGLCAVDLFLVSPDKELGLFADLVFTACKNIMSADWLKRHCYKFLINK